MQRLARLAKRVSLAALAVSGISAAQTVAPNLRTETTLVEVPATVRSTDGDLMPGLVAGDFRLLDDDTPQHARLRENLHEPVAVVVLMQTGGDAPRQFENFPGISTMLGYALGSAPYRVSLVTFDSKPEDRWPFSADAENLAVAFRHPQAGDGGAAVLDAIDYGLDWFDNQHPPGRRVLLLISQKQAGTNAAKNEAIVRRLAETNTAVYSLTFSPSGTWLKDQFTKPRKANGPYFFAPDHPPLTGTFDLLTPLKRATEGMQQNAVATLADLSGGGSLPFGNQRELETQMTNLANELANRYLLDFQPDSNKPGLHRLRLTVPAHPELRVASRNSYWRDPRKAAEEGPASRSGEDGSDH